MLTLTYGRQKPENGDNSSTWYPALAANVSLDDAHTHDGVTSAAIPFANVTPLTTRGDILAYSTTSTRFPVSGSTGDVLTRSTDTGTYPFGFYWATPASTPDQSYELSNLSIAASVGSSNLTISLKQKGGSDASSSSPIKIGFRSSTAATGTYNQRTVTSALSLVIYSTSTLGHVSGLPRYIYVYAIDNSGTVVLGVSTKLFDEGTRQSTTAEGNGTALPATSATTIYTSYAVGALTNVPIRLIGRLTSTQNTAGTWAAVPTEISLQPFPNRNFPTYQVFTTGTTQTYTTPNGVKYLKVRMVGGGGGGGAQGGAGGAGGTTVFRVLSGADILSCTGGGAGSATGVPVAGGSGTISAPASGFSIPGGGGSGSTCQTNSTATVYGGGCMGGGTFFAGGGSAASPNSAAIAGATNSGAGGGGASAQQGAGGNYVGFGGGGGGAYIEAFISNPSATYGYDVGAGGAAGTTGSSAAAAAAGAAGIIIVEEYYA